MMANSIATFHSWDDEMTEEKSQMVNETVNGTGRGREIREEHGEEAPVRRGTVPAWAADGPDQY